MNTIKTITLSFTIALWATFASQAQTNLPTQQNLLTGSFGDGLKIMANALTSGTNWTIIGGYGHSLKGKNNLAFGDVAYSFNQNVGLVVGYDYLWTKGQHQFNAVKGGVTLQTQIYPLKWTGIDWASKIQGTPFVTALIATPRGSSNIGTILTTGLNLDLVDFSKYSLGIGGQYESRSGQGQWNGGYALGHLELSRRF